MEITEQKNKQMIKDIKYGVHILTGSFSLFFGDYEVKNKDNLISIDNGKYDKFPSGNELLELIQIMKITINELNKYSSQLNNIEKSIIATECNNSDDYCDKIIKKMKLKQRHKKDVQIEK